MGDRDPDFNVISRTGTTRSSCGTVLCPVSGVGSRLRLDSRRTCRAERSGHAHLAKHSIWQTDKAFGGGLYFTLHCYRDPQVFVMAIPPSSFAKRRYLRLPPVSDQAGPEVGTR